MQIGYVDGFDPEAGELKASFDARSVTYAFGELSVSQSESDMWGSKKHAHPTDLLGGIAESFNYQ